eukprot:TRINITY_DN3029_c0_g1_i2.p1 TRINITY_DN3029_c0_g1~~TRINITY_DN3029_c0_g1_i2.p1  ORF type:complete len:436 (+),score=96.61 TRINITY_DN3029_c0_g1_i2:255-1562(+)
MGRKRESCDSQEESLEKDSKDEENGNTKKKTEKKAKKEVQRVENKTREIRIPLKDITNVSRTASLATRENLKRSADLVAEEVLSDSEAKKRPSSDAPAHESKDKQIIFKNENPSQAEPPKSLNNSLNISQELNQSDIEGINGSQEFSQPAKESQLTSSPVRATTVSAVVPQTQTRPIFVFFASEYDRENISYLRIKEARDTVPNNFMDNQAQFIPNNRSVVVDWLAEVTKRNGLSPQAFSAGVRIMDTYYSMTKNVTRAFFQLIGAASLMIAAKLEGFDSVSVSEVVYICLAQYSPNAVRNAELGIIRKLDSKLDMITPFHFLDYYIKMARGGDVFSKLCQYLCEISMMDHTCYQFLPSLTAASAVYCAGQIMRRERIWNEDGFTSGYTEAEVIPCADFLHNLFEDNKTRTTLNSIYIIYDATDRYRVSTLPVRS